MTLRIDLFDGAGDAWDRAVRSASGWSHFHLWGWRRVVTEALGHECPYLVATDGGAIKGVLPLVRVRSWLFGHFLVSMPFLNYGGPLGEDDETVRALARAAAAKAESEGVRLLELRSRHRLPVDLSVSHRKITVLLDLPASDPAPLWDGLKAKVRSQVRRPQKEGVTVRFGLDQVDPFHRVFARHMRDLGTPVQGKRLFRKIAEVFPDTWFGCAWLGGRPIAGGCGFRWGSEFEMTWASSLREHSQIAPNMLLYWRFIERSIDEGVTTFNFGRCTPGGGTHRFKKQWGSRDVPLFWYQAGATEAESTPSPDDGRYAWGPRIWRHLPLPVATALGPRIVRYIP